MSNFNCDSFCDGMYVRDTGDDRSPEERVVSQVWGTLGRLSGTWHLNWTCKVEQDFQRERKMEKDFAGL